MAMCVAGSAEIHSQPQIVELRLHIYVRGAEEFIDYLVKVLYYYQFSIN